MNKSIKIGNREISTKIGVAVLAGIVILILLFAYSIGSENQQQAKTAMGSVDSSSLLSAPNDYEGASIDFVGKIFVVEKSDGIYILQMYSDPVNLDGNIAVYIESNEAFNEGDFAQVSGIAGTAVTGENAFGAELTIPTVYATSVTKVDADTAIAPAQTTRNIGSTKKLGGLTIELKKIEFAKDETRIYLYFDNTGSADFSFYDFNSTLVQNRTKIKTVDAYDRGSYDSDGQILAGTTETKKLYYDKLDANEAAMLTIELMNDETYETEEIIFHID